MYNNNDSIGSETPLRAGDRNERRYPHIERLCTDFGLQVAKCPDADGMQPSGSSAFSLAVHYVGNTQYLTPLFSSMRQLEAFVADNMVDILHGYLCGDADLS